MTQRNLYEIILKIFGLYFLKEILVSVPQVVGAIIFFVGSDTRGEGGMITILDILFLAFYFLISYQLLFKTDGLLTKLKLGEAATEEKLNFSVPMPAVLMISLITVSGVILIEEIPNLCKYIFSFIRERGPLYGYTKPGYSPFIAVIVKIVLALLLLGERNRIVDYIMKRRKTDV